MKQALHHTRIEMDAALRPVRDLALVIARFAAIAVLLVYMPVLLAVAVALALTSDGPPLITRVYRRPNGRTVDLWEFRTECWRSWQPTPLGGYLRRSRLHRMPALINVVFGDIAAGERVRPAVDWAD